ncbi:MAG: FAD-dependent oxidoreductase [Sphingobacteriia bacterium]|jgi:succinate dehydrogenase/fumarate reductase flavoprotein subunit
MLADILIIGAGSAGMTCAIRAAQMGKRVLVIDKSDKVGGTLHYTAGHLSGANTKRQIGKSIIDSTEEHYADIVRISRNTMNPIIAQKAVELATSTIDWLDELGYPFHEKAPLIIYGHEPYSKPRTYLGEMDISPTMTNSGKTILQLLLPLWNQLVKDGLIECRLSTKLVSIEKSGEEITSVMVSKNNEQEKLRAKNYVLTTGGYASNPAFFKSVTDGASRLISTANPNSTGDGIIAAQEIGAVFSGVEKHSSTLGAIELIPGSGRVDFWGAWARVSNGIDRKQREIYVNELGVRFMNEYDLNVDERERVVLQQPNARFWLIFDDNALRDGSSVVPQWTIEDLIAESKKENAVWQAATIAELAIKTGLPMEALLNTVNEYNSICENKIDHQFNRTYLEYPIKKAPYYAILVYAYSLISFGGIEVNNSLQVITTDKKSIANLYAAGEILGAAATSGHAFCGGMLLTPALSFGKWLGETL